MSTPQLPPPIALFRMATGYYVSTVGVFTEEQDGRFALGPLGQYLRSGVPGSMRAATLLFAGRTQDVWTELMHSVRTGEPAAPLVYGTDSFTYMAQHPELAAVFDEAMADWTKQVAVASAATSSATSRVAVTRTS